MNDSVLNLDQFNKYQYISFDVFDTLIHRSVSEPYKVFEIIEQLAPQYQSFCKKRVAAEIKARKTSKKQDVTLEEIYSYLSYSAEDIYKLKRIEEAVEIENCLPNEQVIELLQSLSNLGKIIIITTDMYLDAKVIKSILEKVGIKFNYLFISGEVGLTKRSGDLFKHILSELNITSDQLVHIGDDLNNDVAQPERLGIKSVRVYNHGVKLPYYLFVKSNDIIADHLRCLLAYRSQKIHSSSTFRVGYSVLGPLMVDYCQWIHKQKEYYHIEKLVFIAREGYLIKQCYDILFPNEATHYLYMNKNLLRFPLMACLKRDDKIRQFISSIPEHNHMKWNEVCKHLYISKTDMFKVKGVDFNEEVTYNDLVAGKYDRIIDYLIGEQSPFIYHQKHLLEKYIVQNELSGKRIGLVNNSINGNGQKMLEEFMDYCNIKSDFVGLQFVKSKKCDQKLNQRAIGWINMCKQPRYVLHEFTLGCFVLEHLLFEPRGTAIHLFEEDSKVKVVCEKQRMEKSNNEIVLEIQKYTKDFVEDYHSNINIELNNHGLRRYMNFLSYPLAEDAKLVGNLYNDDNEGDILLSDTSIKIPYFYPIIKGNVDRILWKQGYFKNRGKSDIYLFFHNMREIISFYIKKKKLYV